MIFDVFTGNATLAFVNNPTALMIVLIVIVLLFGGKNIPEMMRGMGQGMREFKKAMENEEEAPSAQEQSDARLRAEIEREVSARLEAERRRKQLASEEAPPHREETS